MQTPVEGPVRQLGQEFLNYLPSLAAGLVVLALGIAAGWLVKRAIVRILTWLRLDRLATRTGWLRALGKGDARAALYDFTGTIGLIIVVLVFLDNALELWRLTVLVRLIDSIVVYLPNLAIAGLVVVIGVVIANGVARRVEISLEEEGIKNPRLLARSLKGIMVAIVGTLALWQLGFAREIVLTGFIIGFGALGIAFAIAFGIGSAPAIRSGLEALFERRRNGGG